MSAKDWRLPLNLAIGFHLVVALGAIYLPDILDSKPRYEDIYTVNLINLADLPAPAPTPAAPSSPSQPPPVEQVAENAVSIAQQAPTVAPAPPKAISIKPSKRKKKRVVPKPAKQNRVDDTAQRKKIAEMVRAEQRAIEEARILQQEADLEKKLADEARQRVSQARSTLPTPRKAGPSSASGASSSQLSAAENQYYASVVARLQPYWSLPEYKTWDPATKATVVITITKDGAIVDSFFENTSGDKFFDRFVKKTLLDVGQLPPIPNVLRKQRMEIGLVFSPEGIR